MSAVKQESRPAFSQDDYIPPEAWGCDHFSTLAYAECKIVDFGFSVAFDSHMRQKRRNWRVLLEKVPSCRRETMAFTGQVMDPKYGTRLKDGAVLGWHDDWDCIHDMAHFGVFTEPAEKIDVGSLLNLSPLGLKLAAALRAHKANGGSFKNFEIPDEIRAALKATGAAP